MHGKMYVKWNPALERWDVTSGEVEALECFDCDYGGRLLDDTDATDPTFYPEEAA